MQRMLLVLIFACLGPLLSATPDRAVWVHETLLGFSGTAYVVRQVSNDNLGSHHENNVKVHLIARELASNQEIKKVLIADVWYDSGKITKGKPEEFLKTALEKHPELFFGLEYAMALGIPNSINEKYLLEHSALIRIYSKEGIDTTVFDLSDQLKRLGLKSQPRSLLQIYRYRSYYLFLLDFNSAYMDDNYSQRIVAVQDPPKD